MLQIKILGATPTSGKPLCLSCKMAKRVRGQNCEEIIFCHLFSRNGSPGPVPFRVAECGDYHPVNMPWLHEMEEMAWKIEARRRGPVGFNDPDARGGEMEVVITRPKKSNLPGTPDAD